MLDRYPNMFGGVKQPSIAQQVARVRITRAAIDDCYLDTSRVSGIFAKGTLIDTPAGRMKIECLASGDVVLSFKNGQARVQSCQVVPDRCIPEPVLSVRAGYLNASDDLIMLPNQLVRLHHWLAAALFETRYPYATAGHVCFDHKIELVPKAQTQFFRLDIGVCDAITANGVMCITDPCQIPIKDDRRSPIKNYGYRHLTPDETILALEAGIFFKKSGKKT